MGHTGWYGNKEERIDHKPGNHEAGEHGFWAFPYRREGDDAGNHQIAECRSINGGTLMLADGLRTGGRHKGGTKELIGLACLLYNRGCGAQRSVASCRALT